MGETLNGRVFGSQSCKLQTLDLRFFEQFFFCGISCALNPFFVDSAIVYISATDFNHTDLNEPVCYCFRSKTKRTTIGLPTLNLALLAAMEVNRSQLLDLANNKLMVDNGES